jgi:hypothetical protein
LININKIRTTIFHPHIHHIHNISLLPTATATATATRARGAFIITYFRGNV